MCERTAQRGASVWVITLTSSCEETGSCWERPSESWVCKSRCWTITPPPKRLDVKRISSLCSLARNGIVCVYVCTWIVCVCVCARERESRVCVCVCVHARESCVCVCVWWVLLAQVQRAIVCEADHFRSVWAFCRKKSPSCVAVFWLHFNNKRIGGGGGKKKERSILLFVEVVHTQRDMREDYVLGKLLRARMKSIWAIMST